MKCDDKLVDTDFNIVIGNVLKEKRLEKGWSLLELARKMNNKITRQTLFHYENGETKIRRIYEKKKQKISKVRTRKV